MHLRVVVSWDKEDIFCELNLTNFVQLISDVMEAFLTSCGVASTT